MEATLHRVGQLMDESTAETLEQGGVVDITTTGRRSGRPHRIEIAFHHLENGDYYLTGRPGLRRDWLANLLANPEFTVHLEDGVTADVRAVAEPITDPEERAGVLYRILTESWDVDPDKARSNLPHWVESAPLVRFRVV